MCVFFSRDLIEIAIPSEVQATENEQLEAEDNDLEAAVDNFEVS